MSPTPWRIEYLHGEPRIVDARGYTVASTVNAIEGDTKERLMAQIVGSVNAVAENRDLARIVVEMDERGDIATPKRHHASSLLAQAIVGGSGVMRKCGRCDAPVQLDVVPSEQPDGTLVLECPLCERRLVEERKERREAAETVQAK